MAVVRRAVTLLLVLTFVEVLCVRDNRDADGVTSVSIADGHFRLEWQNKTDQRTTHLKNTLSRSGRVKFNTSQAVENVIIISNLQVEEQVQPTGTRAAPSSNIFLLSGDERSTPALLLDYTLIAAFVSGDDVVWLLPFAAGGLKCSSMLTYFALRSVMVILSCGLSYTASLMHGSPLWVVHAAGAALCAMQALRYWFAPSKPLSDPLLPDEDVVESATASTPASTEASGSGSLTSKQASKNASSAALSAAIGGRSGATARQTAAAAAADAGDVAKPTAAGLTLGSEKAVASNSALFLVGIDGCIDQLAVYTSASSIGNPVVISGWLAIGTVISSLLVVVAVSCSRRNASVKSFLERCPLSMHCANWCLMLCCAVYVDRNSKIP